MPELLVFGDLDEIGDWVGTVSEAWARAKHDVVFIGQESLPVCDGGAMPAERAASPQEAEANGTVYIPKPPYDVRASAGDMRPADPTQVTW